MREGEGEGTTATGTAHYRAPSLSLTRALLTPRKSVKTHTHTKKKVYWAGLGWAGLSHPSPPVSLEYIYIQFTTRSCNKRTVACSSLFIQTDPKAQAPLDHTTLRRLTLLLLVVVFFPSLES